MASTEFGRYVLHRRLARGGMAEIFLAEQRATAGVSKLVVIKRILPELCADPSYVDMFLDEARLASKLSHPNVVQIFDFGEIDGRYYLTMEYLAGEHLSSWRRQANERGLNIPANVVVRVISDLLDGLHYAHTFSDGDRKLDIVHRDVSPSNTIVTYQGVVKVVDFGIARAADRQQQKTGSGALKGKRGYASPEQYEGRALDLRIDLWAAGVILHELLSGQRLFMRDNQAATMHAVLTADVPKLQDQRDDVPPALDSVIERALARDPEDRWGSAREFRAALDELSMPPVRLEEFMTDFFGKERAKQVASTTGSIPSLGAPITDSSLPTSIGAWTGDEETPGPTRVEGQQTPATPASIAEPTPTHPAAQKKPASKPKPRWPWILFAATTMVLGAAFGVSMLGEEEDPRYANAFVLAQRGEFTGARAELEPFLVDEPDDPDGRVLRLLVQWWTEAPQIDAALTRARDTPLDAVQRAFVEGIDLVNAGRNEEAIAYLRPIQEANPDRPELLYILGEALWHDQELEEGAATLLQAVEIAPGWGMALHHPADFYLDSGEEERLEHIVEQLRTEHPAEAAILLVRIRMAQRRYPEAMELARAAEQAHADSGSVAAILAEAANLNGEPMIARDAARNALEHWPVDDREVGGYAHIAEQYLYEGEIEQLERSTTGLGMRSLTEALWRHRGGVFMNRPTRRGLLTPTAWVAAYLAGAHAEGRDERAFWDGYPERAIAAYGEGLAAELEDDDEAAISAYRRGLEVPQYGHVRMLIAHHLARVLHAQGDARGAADACDAVLHPRVYRTQRALLEPDCVLWTAEASDDPEEARVLLRGVVDRWRGAFDHPSVVAARELLHQPSVAEEDGAGGSDAVDEATP